MIAPSHWPALKPWILTTLLVLAGVDGFLLLEPLREAGSRPFFLIFLIFVGMQAARGALAFSRIGLLALGAIAVLSAASFAVRGIHLPPSADKAPLTQYLAQGTLFFIGFCPLALRLRCRLEEPVLQRALWAALGINLVIVAIDFFALVTGAPRPLEGSFWAPGGRVFPTGLFSEPSYLAGYAAILLPAALFSRPLWQIALASVVAGAAFFVGDVRSFFPVYAAGLTALALCRWGFNWRFMLGVGLGLVVLVAIALQLNLSSVDENLSSAYRLGNTLSFLQHASESDWLIGSGFGSAHFLYPDLDHPAFLLLSPEYRLALEGEGFRIPVFNVWVRLFVEIGIPATILLVGVLWRALRSRRVFPQVKILLVASMAFGLSTDSYIYGCMTLAMFLAFCVVNVNVEAAEKVGSQRLFRRRTPRDESGVAAL